MNNVEAIITVNNPPPVVVPPPTFDLTIKGISKKDLRFLRGLFGNIDLCSGASKMVLSVAGQLNSALPDHGWKVYHKIRDDGTVVPHDYSKIPD